MTLTKTSTSSSRQPRLRPGRRRLAVVATALALVLAASSCGTDTAGTAATVGSVALGETELAQAATDSMSAAAGAATAGETAVTQQERITQMRVVLTNQVRHQLVTQMAAAAGVSVTEQEIAAFLVTDPSQISAAARETVRDFLLARKVVGTATDTPVNAVHVVTQIITTYPDRASAIADREKFLADPAAMDAAVAANAQGAGTQEFNLLEQAQSGLFGIFIAKPGDILVVNQASQVLLVRIVSRDEQESSFGELEASLGLQPGVALNVETASPTAVSLTWMAIASRAKDIAVTVNPRFGVWDPTSLWVAASSSGM